jgi:putative transcriptional regulator
MTKRRTTSARRSRPRSGRRNIAAEILNGLDEAIRFEKGEDTGTIFKAAPISAGMATVDPAPEFSARRIAAVRAKLGLTQPVFAGLLNVSPETVKAWEQGKSPPLGAAKRLLELADLHPAALLEAVHFYSRTSSGNGIVAERRAGVEGRRRGGGR